MVQTITQRLEICVDINIEISKVDDYTKKLSQIRKRSKGGGTMGCRGRGVGKCFEKKQALGDGYWGPESMSTTNFNTNSRKLKLFGISFSRI